MTITVTEFQKNFHKYESMAMTQTVWVENKKTGIKFSFKGSNPMEKRLWDMKAGKGTSLEEAMALCNED